MEKSPLPLLQGQIKNWLRDFPDLKTVFDVFTQAGYEPRLVGGCVRDALLCDVGEYKSKQGGATQKSPDFDIAVPCDPNTTMAILAENHIKHIPIGLDYGCVMAVFDDGNTGKGRNTNSFEITSLRADVATDGRRATVAYTTDWSLDAKRRDLTINALSCDINGLVYDYYDGINDLKNGVVRFVGDAEIRIQEDILRILRYYRFLQRCATPNSLKNPPPYMQKAWIACQNHAPKIATLSGERIWTEICTILASKNTVFLIEILDIMHRHGVLDRVIPENGWDKIFYNKICQQLDKITPQNESCDDRGLIRFCGLLKNSQIDPQKIMEKLKLSNYEKRIIILLMCPLNAPENKEDIGVFYKCLCDHGMALTHARLVLSGVKNAENIMESILDVKDKKFPLKGQDMMDLGMPHGRIIGDALSYAQKQWYQSACTLNKQSLLTMTKEYIKQQDIE